MKKISSGYSSDSEQNHKQDLSVLRKPISVGLSGFLESKRAYDNGTQEMRRLLSRECDILYECKVCRNLFRSLTNFISHKRVYCRTAFSNITNHCNINNGYMDQDVSTIIQEEKDFTSSSTKDNKTYENPNKDLSSIIERLLKREQANRLMKLTDFYDQVNNKLTQDELLRKRHELQLERVPNSSVAVYQTVKKESNDNIKKEVNEVNDLVYNRKTIVGSDGKVVVSDKKSTEKNRFMDRNFKENQQKVTDEEAVSCDVCNLKFSTEKTLKLHIQTKHISSTFVYQCPSCSQTFLQPRAVFRHLSNDHKKSIRRIRMMRDSILRRRVRTDEIQTKGPSRELARLQNDNEKRDAENKAWMKNSDMANNSPMCAYCGKTFERKAVLTTHLNNCPMKNKCPGPQTRRFTGLTNAGNNNKNESNSSNRKPSVLNGNDLNELRDIKEMDLNNAEECLSLSGAPSRDVSPINKRKRKRTTKILQQSDSIAEASDSLSEFFWNINTNSENLSLKTVSFNKSPSVTPPLDPKPNTEKEQVPEKSAKSTDYALASKNHKEVSFYCRICVKKFDVLSNLRRHISMFHYRKRKFGCKLCDYRAFRKYDVINHLNSSHSITGEKEEVLQYVIVKESKTERNEENIDADVMIDEDGTLDLNVPQKNVEKKRRGPKVKEHCKSPSESPPRSSPSNVEHLKCESKFKRTSSNLSLSSNEEGSSSTSLSKRPIRNRIKPVNKDFVYDLSNLLKKDMVLSEKTHRRRNTQTALDESSRDSVTPPNVSNTETPPQLETCRNINYNPIAKGAAFAMAQAAVSACTACFYKPPELPAERPPIINRLIPPINVPETKSTGWTVLKPPDIRRLSDDNILHNQAKKRRMESADSSQSATQSLFELFPPKIELNINGDAKVKLLPDRTQNEVSDSEKIIVKLFSSEKEFKERLVANKLAEPEAMISSSVKSSPSTSFLNTSSATNGFANASQLQISAAKPSSGSDPPSNMKRITMLERLDENKKLRGHFLKLA